jgi:hypothetical protein
MKVIRIHFHLFRNEEWFQLFTEFRDLVLKYNPDALNISELWVTFLILYTDADTALEVIRKSMNTVLMHEADYVRNRTFRGFVDAVKSALNHFDPQKREAARLLMILLDHFGNLARKAPNEETAGIYNLMQELNGAYADKVRILLLEDWTRQLAADNEAYEVLVKDRNVEVAQRSKLRMKEIRSEMQDVYAKIVERIEAVITLNGETPQFMGFVNELNAFLKRYADVLAQRKGKSRNINL